jgi:hypothetical protein
MESKREWRKKKTGCPSHPPATAAKLLDRPGPRDTAARKREDGLFSGMRFENARRLWRGKN